MFLDRFFGKTAQKSGAAARLPRKRRLVGSAGSRMWMEPLEDRSLLSIGPAGFFGPFLHDQNLSSFLDAAESSGTCLSNSPSTGSSSSSSAAAVGSVNATSSLIAKSSATVATDTTTHFVVSMASGATSGVPLTVKLVAEDAQNHFVSDYSGTADLSSSDGSATLPASVTFQNGHARFQVTLATSGQQTLTATDSVDASRTGTATTNVAAADVATHFVLYMPSGATSGKAVTVHVVAEDVQNDFVSTYTGTTDLSSSDDSVTLPASVTFQHGHATFQATFATPGLQTVTATDSANSSLTGTAATNVATPAVATHFVLYLAQGVATGSPVTVQLAAEDAQNNFVSNYTGTANLTGSDASATLPASVTFHDGRASFQVTFATQGQQTVTATDSVNLSLTGTATTNVVIAHFAMHLPRGVTGGVPVTVQLVAMDAQNSAMSAYNGTANLTSSDGSITLPASVTFQNGRASFQVTFGTPGPQTVTATDSVSSSPVGTATTYVAAPAVATHFIVYMTPGAITGTPVTVRVVPEDAQNHFVPNYTGTLNLSSSDTSATLPASITFQQGHANFFQVTFATPGQQTVTVTDSANVSLAGTATTNVAAPAVATHFVVHVRSGASIGAPATVVVVAEDAHNHFVANYTGTADLSSSDASATLRASVTFEHGYARFQVTFTTLGQQTVTATDSVNSSLTGTATTNVIDKSSNTRRGFFSRFD
jgi:hypothetical protein